jgi:hypothetical protein
MAPLGMIDAPRSRRVLRTGYWSHDPARRHLAGGGRNRPSRRASASAAIIVDGRFRYSGVAPREMIDGRRSLSDMATRARLDPDGSESRQGYLGQSTPEWRCDDAVGIPIAQGKQRNWSRRRNGLRRRRCPRTSRCTHFQIPGARCWPSPFALRRRCPSSVVARPAPGGTRPYCRVARASGAMGENLRGPPRPPPKRNRWRCRDWTNRARARARRYANASALNAGLPAFAWETIFAPLISADQRPPE